MAQTRDNPLLSEAAILDAASGLAAAMPDDVDLPQGETFVAIALSTHPLWQELGRIGWCDGFGGEEWSRIFGPVIATLHREANPIRYETELIVVNPADVYSGNIVQGEIHVRAAGHEMPESGSHVSFTGHVWIVTRTGVRTEGGRPCYIALLVPPS